MNLETELALYSQGDYERLGMMKKAADAVFDYYRWIMDDHKRMMDHRGHERQIHATLDNVSAVFNATEFTEALVKYFIANTLKAIQEMADPENKAVWLPFSDEDLLKLYDKDQVKSIMADRNVQDCAMYAGRFVSEATDAYPDITEIAEGDLVGCDLDLVSALSWRTLLVACDVEDDGTLICVGKAMMSVREVTENMYKDLDTREPVNAVVTQPLAT